MKSETDGAEPGRHARAAASLGAAAPPKHSRQLAHLQRVWQTLGRDDPLWAVLSHPDKRGRRWDAAEFLATGRVEIDSQLATLAAGGYPRGRELALDFGCGAGRLTRALGAHFGRAVGVDVSASMIAAAAELNADVGNVEFRENASPQLEGIADASVDFVFSHITLQHIPAALAAGYVGEFFRVLAPGGAAVFQFVAGNDDSWRGRLFGLASNRWLNPLRRLWWRRRAVFEMHVLSPSVLEARLARHPSLRLLAATDDQAAGPGWRGRRWVVVNDAEMPQRVDRGDHVLYACASDAHIGAPLLAGEVHEPHVLAAVRKRLHRGDVVLDVGANIGIVSMLAASRVGPDGRVIAVEPMAGNRILIGRAAQANGFRNVELIAAAASDREGHVDLRMHPATSNSAMPAAAGERLREARGRIVRVRTCALDDELAGLDRLDLVKIDIEGMEPLALRGLEKTLATFRPVLLSEFHPWAIARAAATSPIDYLARLRRIYPAITILHRDGTHERCSDPAEVMQVWQRLNEAAGQNGRLHLDLLFDPAD